EVVDPLGDYSGVYYRDAASNIKTLRIVGSNDNETFIIESPVALGGEDGKGKNAKIELIGGSGNDKFLVRPDNTGLLDGLKTPITIDGGGQAGDEVVINDVASKGNNTYTITSTDVTRDGKPAISYGRVTRLTLNTGKGNDEVNVNSTSAAVTQYYLINTGDGNDKITVGTKADGLGGHKARIFVNGGGNDNELVVEDSASKANKIYEVKPGLNGWSGAVQRMDLFEINHQNVKKVTLNTGSAKDEVNVMATAADVTDFYLINTGDGDDKITVGTKADGLSGHKARVFIEGGGNENEVIVEDSATKDDRAEEMGGGPGKGWNSTLKRTDKPEITYSNINKVTLNTGSKVDTIKITATHMSVSKGTFINTGDGNDTITIGGAKGLDEI